MAASDLCCPQDFPDSVAEAAARKPVSARAKAKSPSAHIPLPRMRSRRTNPDPVPLAVGGSTVAEAVVAQDILPWEHHHHEATVSSAAGGLVAFEDPDRMDLWVVAVVAGLRAHSRNLADRHGRSNGSSLRGRVGSAGPQEECKERLR